MSCVVMHWQLFPDETMKSQIQIFDELVNHHLTAVDVYGLSMYPWRLIGAQICNETTNLVVCACSSYRNVTNCIEPSLTQIFQTVDINSWSKSLVVTPNALSLSPVCYRLRYINALFIKLLCKAWTSPYLVSTSPLCFHLFGESPCFHFLCWRRPIVFL